MANRHVRKVKADVNAALLALHAAHGGLRPSEVVAAAAPVDSPLHGEFEWDDEKAGHEFRLWQARHLIRVAVIETTVDDGTVVADRFVHVPPTAADRDDATREGMYQPMRVVVQHADWYTRALGALLAKLSAAEHAAEELQRAAQASAAPDDTQAKITLALQAFKAASAAVAALH